MRLRSPAGAQSQWKPAGASWEPEALQFLLRFEGGQHCAEVEHAVAPAALVDAVLAAVGV
ncbi:MAG: hypothetical protein M3179_00015 [Actinomycetota bacterium]|nr:hypothetical protein [Actinomycetota bacterium]